MDDKYINDFISIANVCINSGFQPSHFKNSISIIIFKPNKLAYNLPKTFYPIVFFNTFRKIIKKVISERIQVQSITNNFIHSNQLRELKHCSIIDIGLYLTYLIHARQVKSLNISTLAFDISSFFLSLNYQLLPIIFNKARLKSLCSFLIT